MKRKKKTVQLPIERELQRYRDPQNTWFEIGWEHGLRGYKAQYRSNSRYMNGFSRAIQFKVEKERDKNANHTDS